VQAAVAQEASPTLSDQFFRVEWTVSPGRLGDSRITGYVYNEYGDAAENVQLRISEVDASGPSVSLWISHGISSSRPPPDPTLPFGGQMAAIRMDRRAFLHAMARR